MFVLLNLDLVKASDNFALFAEVAYREKKTLYLGFSRF